MTTVTPTFMQMLKESTNELHRAAEGTAFQQALMQCRLPRERFVESLGQLRFIHQAMENHLRQLMASHPETARIVNEQQFNETNLEADLALLGGDAMSAKPLAATRELITRIDEAARDEPMALLGFHYVFEGSKNGSKHLAAVVRRAYTLSGTDGTRYLDPYGDRQRETWAAFRAAMDATEFGEEDRVAMTVAAKRAFAGITRMYNEIYSEPGGAAVGAQA